MGPLGHRPNTHTHTHPGLPLQADYFSCVGTVVYLRKENCMYQACPTQDCNKKVIDEQNGLYRCEKCDREFPNFKYRMILSVSPRLFPGLFPGDLPARRATEKGWQGAPGKGICSHGRGVSGSVLRCDSPLPPMVEAGSPLCPPPALGVPGPSQREAASKASVPPPIPGLWGERQNARDPGFKVPPLAWEIPDHMGSPACENGAPVPQPSWWPPSSAAHLDSPAGGRETPGQPPKPPWGPLWEGVCLWSGGGIFLTALVWG